MAATQKLPEPQADHVQASWAADLEARHGAQSPQAIIELAARDLFPGAITAVSSFGADSAVLLHMLAKVDPALPVIFLDTGQHFPELLAYRDALVADLGLTGLRVLSPEPASLAAADPLGDLHASDTDACCAIRKVAPMARAVEPFAAWLTGRKRFQSATRASLPVFEAVGPRLRINPLAGWEAADLAHYMRRNNLRKNPLVAYGYLSIGCLPCTKPVGHGEDGRAGRWAGHAKTECGIHLSGLAQPLAAAGQS